MRSIPPALDEIEPYADKHGFEDYKDVLHLAGNGQIYWQQSKRMMTRGKRWYDQDVPIVTPKQIESHVPSTAPTLVNDAADHLAGNNPDFEVKERRESAKALEDRARVQTCLNTTFELIGREWGHPLHRTLSIQGGWSGMMCARIGVYDGWDVKAPSIEDIYWQPADPRYVFPDPGTLGKRYVVYRMHRNVGLIRQAWPNWEGHMFPAVSSESMGAQGTYGTDINRKRLDMPLSDNSVVDWVEYWDEKYKCYIANGVPVFREEYGADFVEHGLGSVPWVVRPSGYGDSTGEAHERFRSMLSYVFHWLDLEARLITQYKWIVEDTAWPTWLAPDDMRGLDIQPGTINFVQNPESIKAFRAVREDSVKPEAVVQLLGYVKDEIERATYPVILKGQAPSGIRAGYPIAILSTQARLKFAAPTDALRNIFQELAYKTLAVIKYRFKVPTQVMDGYKLKPEDYDNYMGRLSVTLEPHLPTDLASKLPMLEFLVGTLGYSKAMAMKELGITNPEEVRELRWAEDMEDDPRVKQAGAEVLLQDMIPEYQSAAASILKPNQEIQQLTLQVQQLTAQIQLLAQQAQLAQAQGQGQQQGPPGAPPIPIQGNAPQGQQGPPQPPQGPPVVPGKAGGTDFGQNLFNPMSGGANKVQLNPETQMSSIARNLRANRTMQEFGAQEQVYGDPGAQNLGI